MKLIAHNFEDMHLNLDKSLGILKWRDGEENRWSVVRMSSFKKAQFLLARGDHKDIEIHEVFRGNKDEILRFLRDNRADWVVPEVYPPTVVAVSSMDSETRPELEAAPKTSFWKWTVATVGAAAAAGGAYYYFLG
jgi:hypothetical protein